MDARGAVSKKVHNNSLLKENFFRIFELNVPHVQMTGSSTSENSAFLFTWSLKAINYSSSG